jgi:putative tricarboxylic transport membrane protein
MRVIAWLRELWRGDNALALLFLLLSVFYLAYATTLRGGLMSDLVGPRTYPILLGILGIGLSLLFFFRKFSSLTRARLPRERTRTLRGEMRDLQGLALIIGYVLVMDTLGYLIATILFATATVKWLGQPTWRASVVFAVILTAATFSLFTWAFDVRLPVGVILPVIR